MKTGELLDGGMEFAVPVPPRAIGYAALMEPRDDYTFQEMEFSPKPTYEQYLRMHKVFVGRRGADQLEGIYDDLKGEDMPRYLATAGWAAVEAAMVRTDHPTQARLDLLENGVQCWERALANQRDLNADGPSCLVEYSAPFRSALDIAVSPLLRGVIQGYVSRKACQTVFEDCLNIAQANAVRINLMAREGDIEGLGEHIGLGYECNALLTVNRRFSGTLFAIPSMIRSDSGYHHSQQTHDLMIVQQNRGEITRLTPVEIKAAANNRDRQRYKALLVRGKMHLSEPGSYRPEDTLRAIGACHEGTATLDERRIARRVTKRFMSMFRDYCAGENMPEPMPRRSLTVFHNNALVVANHPGLMPRAS